jgi:hypothetical protein
MLDWEAGRRPTITDVWPIEPTYLAANTAAGNEHSTGPERESLHKLHSVSLIEKMV